MALKTVNFIACLDANNRFNRRRTVFITKVCVTSKSKKNSDRITEVELQKDEDIQKISGKDKT